MRIGLLVLGLSGCHQTFGLVEVKLDGDAGTVDSDLSTDLVAYYPMEALAANTLEDVARNNDGTCQAGMCPSVTAGAVGNGLLFDGALSLIDVPGSADLATTSGVTAAVWVRLDSPPAVARCAISKVLGGSGDNSWQLCVDAQMRVVVYGTGTSAVLGGPIVVGAWTHLATRWDAGDAQFAVFINGVMGNDETETLAFDGSPLVIGGDRDAGNPASHWVGALDEARIYHRALSNDEISGLATRD